MADVKFLQNDGSRVSDVFFEDLFKIKDVSDLTGLCYASSMCESFPAIVCNCILSGICKATKH